MSLKNKFLKLIGNSTEIQLATTSSESNLAVGQRWSDVAKGDPWGALPGTHVAEILELKNGWVRYRLERPLIERHAAETIFKICYPTQVLPNAAPVEAEGDAKFYGLSHQG